MTSPWFKLAAVCSVVLAIVFFCVIFGGYSSFLRSQNRIAAATSLLAEASTRRLELADTLAEISGSTHPGLETGSDMLSIRNMQVVLDRFSSLETPAPDKLIKDLESAHAALTTDLQKLMAGLGQHPDQEFQIQAADIRKELFGIQDQIFVAKKYYNKEVNYFNSRKKVFPGFIIARIFGFQDLAYPLLSEGIFLSGEKTFSTKAS